MMEVDHISYIFGSFTRRRQSHEMNAAKRRSIETQKISHDRSNSTPHTSKKSEIQPQSPRAKSVCNFIVDESKFKCTMCGRHFIEPRVLPCLHTFCTRCLQELEANDFALWHNGSSDGSSGSGRESSSRSGSGGSGYVSDRHDPTASEGSWSPTSNSKGISCPSCGIRAELPQDGILGFPPNYLLQHRMVLATLNAQSTRLLCDICSTDVPATSRCMECAVSLCLYCAEAHRCQRTTSHHEVLSLEEARRKGITRVRRQIMCTVHPERELTIFCSTCYQVICRDCIAASHRGHMCETVARAAKSHTKNIRSAIERAKVIAEQSSAASNRLQAASKRIETHCNQVQTEVERFIENYVRSVDEHRKNLYQQIQQAREEKLRTIEQHRIELQKRLKDTKDVVGFVDELLNEGTDVEVLSFVKPVLKKLEVYNKPDNKVADLKLSESLQFLPEEIVQNSENFCPLYGVITTQTVSPKHCVLHTEALQNLRVGKRIEVILELKDRNNMMLARGGERVSAELRYKDPVTPKTLPIQVEDRRDGTYCLSFTPDVVGKLLLTVAVKGQPIKDAPVPVTIRTLKPHHGTFHCCSFCSSGGSKEAACGCGGKMPGGYRGCGHGHEGHPGRRHWSCCGNTIEHSECARSNSTTHYQFTL